jgi:hypothetical protein
MGSGRRGGYVARMNSAHRFAFALSFLVACGGKVVFVAEGDGGSGGSTSSSSSSSGSSTSSSSGGGCSDLKIQLDAAVAAAIVCNPLINQVQCDGTAVIHDACDCPSILLNEKNPNQVANAKAAYSAWTTAGCGPAQCGKLCVPATSGFCQPDPNGTTGTCVSAQPL